ncbi:MAG: NAD(P)/FAD-dependent oxidoreductase [archaeon]
MEKYNLVIIGAGPAGMSAALFAEGDGLTFRLVEKGKPCGFVEEVINTNFTNLENYLGLHDLSGTETSDIFRSHLASREIPIVSEDITRIHSDGNSFLVESLEKRPYQTDTIILATGTSPRRLNVPGLENVSGKVHYGINKDFSDYTGKPVLVVGGRNSGAVTAVRLKDLGANPIVLEMGAQTTAKEKYMERIHQLEIPYFLNSTLERVNGNSEIDSADLIINGERTKAHPVAIFGCIGYVPNNALARSLGLTLDSQGYVEVDRKMQTNREGVFAAGDVNGGVKMIAVASGEGAIAEYYANGFVKQKWKKQ